ncbi:DUF455 family protein [Mariprofundus sp. EBB-1]|uniref:ferritin-like domain-containing protein n=1 Tax=Mariprofundus sp. EBB-1 TaxID=2650971 RepID=UPI000EF20CF9|nr:ferritin-like domain-containing protein [Mariprofundus sp. EBB-1]RLL54966.1 DUF455 family protein [Mariprofundus sp. EBB-1]
MNEMRHMATECLNAADPDEKLRGVRALMRSWQQGNVRLDTKVAMPSLCQPGRPDKPSLVRGSDTPRRGFGTSEGRAIMMHAIAHIEFNAINLALDAVQRFANMPDQYYTDWLQVAFEEAYHFELVRAHLRHLGGEYGDYVAHGGLWEMCEKTAHDVLIRMALVPRVLEARGLDVTPGIQKKLAQANDHNAVSILDIILRDEINHVAIGNRWYRYCCDQRDLDTVDTFTTLLAEFYPKGLMGPYNMVAREQAGFTASELSLLNQPSS